MATVATTCSVCGIDDRKRLRCARLHRPAVDG
jgi:hypothetical protein